MSILNNSLLLDGTAGGGGGGGTYQISRSLRFNRLDSTSLSRSIASAGNRKTWTWAAWVKTVEPNLSSNFLFAAGADLNNNTRLSIDSGNSLNLANVSGGTATTLRVTTALYRDPSAWMHIVLAVDTTQATAADRIKLYVNGSEVTSFSTSNAPTQNLDLGCNAVGTFYIGRNFSSNYLSAYLADIHFINGSALTPSSFGEFDATTGQWNPIAYTGSYGTNGYHLEFSNNSAATAAALGADSSGNGNNFTPTNLSVTAGTGNDSLVDSPTSYGSDTGVGSEVRGNYCVWNKIHPASTVTLANGNLDHSSVTVGQAAIGTIGMSTGKWYWEIVTTGGTTQTQVGIYNTAASTLYNLAANNTVYGIRFDADAGTLDYTANGSSWTSIATGLTSGPYFPYTNNNGTTAKTVSANFGQRAFSYTAPTGYKTLCTQNFPAPTIVNPTVAVDTVLYTGTGGTLTPTSSLGFSPDLVWIKSRSATTDHALYDSVRGTQARLESNNTDAEVTADGGVTAFNAAGFTLGTLAQVNTSAATYAAWCWDKSAADGFDIVTYTGNGANRTIAHSLGIAPSFVIVKQHTAASTTNWAVWHSALANTEYLLLNSNAAKATGTTYWNSTSPTSTTLSLGTSADVNTNSGTYVAYLWSPVSQYSAFGSYVGNNAADGAFIYLGFRPAVVMLKLIAGGTGNWLIYDDKRAGFNVQNFLSYPNAINAEITTTTLDFYSNGFKLRTTAGDLNSNLGTYLYAAWAATPFSYARAR